MRLADRVRLVSDIELLIDALTADDWPVWREARRQALAEAPYAFGSTLAEWSGDGDYEERWRQRLEAVPFNVVARRSNRVVGMVSGTEPEAGEVELISMWVEPDERGRGVGDALIRAVLEWAGRQGAEAVSLQVREGNEKAIHLYERLGFVDVGSACEPGDPYPERRMVRAVRQESELRPDS
jgi:ribosomal protein S18 acetylase RimI-like enzyme